LGENRDEARDESLDKTGEATPPLLLFEGVSTVEGIAVGGTAVDDMEELFLTCLLRARSEVTPRGIGRIDGASGLLPLRLDVTGAFSELDEAINA